MQGHPYRIIQKYRNTLIFEARSGTSVVHTHTYILCVVCVLFRFLSSSFLHPAAQSPHAAAQLNLAAESSSRELEMEMEMNMEDKETKKGRRQSKGKGRRNRSILQLASSKASST